MDEHWIFIPILIITTEVVVSCTMKEWQMN